MSCVQIAVKRLRDLSICHLGGSRLGAEYHFSQALLWTQFFKSADNSLKPFGFLDCSKMCFLEKQDGTYSIGHGTIPNCGRMAVLETWFYTYIFGVVRPIVHTDRKSWIRKSAIRLIKKRRTLNLTLFTSLFQIFCHWILLSCLFPFPWSAKMKEMPFLSISLLTSLSAVDW